uniref:F-box domain-containing protein n=1 Tax=Calcidiscus leptoporus TaxID=127549 RepID=A0A7S0JIB0_9EUKA|mmetsp:Transcript_60026/g.137600  ORF Transcript_60026/g.137600 Transcript_60026/m.137600 type:complete len:121 (+) Transcript_60026:128-490(+)
MKTRPSLQAMPCDMLALIAQFCIPHAHVLACVSKTISRAVRAHSRLSRAVIVWTPPIPIHIWYCRRQTDPSLAYRLHVFMWYNPLLVLHVWMLDDKGESDVSDTESMPDLISDSDWSEHS